MVGLASNMWDVVNQTPSMLTLHNPDTPVLDNTAWAEEVDKFLGSLFTLLVRGTCNVVGAGLGWIVLTWPHLLVHMPNMINALSLLCCFVLAQPLDLMQVVNSCNWPIWAFTCPDSMYRGVMLKLGVHGIQGQLSELVLDWPWDQLPD